MGVPSRCDAVLAEGDEPVEKRDLALVRGEVGDGPRAEVAEGSACVIAERSVFHCHGRIF